ncbi:hypothetical protein [Allosphingosinicella sp.]
MDASLRWHDGGRRPVMTQRPITLVILLILVLLLIFYLWGWI